MSTTDAQSFYFFDFDDNIMQLDTRILIENTKTEEILEIGTAEFALISPQFGQPGPYQSYSTFEDTYKYFDDIPPDKLQPGQEQYFVQDIKAALEKDPSEWQMPSWDLFVYACNKQRPVSIITARGHSPETIKSGLAVLQEAGWIDRKPNYLTIYPVSNPDVQRSLGDEKLKMTVPDLKYIAIQRSVDAGLDTYGHEPAHHFGMSDDDPENVNLIIKAMRDCKQTYPDKRFFAINTHMHDEVKMEVFPVDFPVTTYGSREDAD